LSWSVTKIIRLKFHHENGQRLDSEWLQRRWMFEHFVAVHRHVCSVLTCILRAVIHYWLWGCSDLPLWSYCVSLWVFMFFMDKLSVSGRKGVVQCPLYGGGILMGCGNVWREWRLSSGYTVSELRSSENSRSQWPRGLRRRSAATRLLRFWVRYTDWQRVVRDEEYGNTRNPELHWYCERFHPEYQMNGYYVHSLIYGPLKGTTQYCGW